jgi:acetoin utilization deacetylase AcuC-like enzyme
MSRLSPETAAALAILAWCLVAAIAVVTLVKWRAARAPRPPTHRAARAGFPRHGLTPASTA